MTVPFRLVARKVLINIVPAPHAFTADQLGTRKPTLGDPLLDGRLRTTEMLPQGAQVLPRWREGEGGHLCPKRLWHRPVGHGAAVRVGAGLTSWPTPWPPRSGRCLLC